MAISDFHPEYSAMLPDWQLMRDSYAGERNIKFGASLLPTPNLVEVGIGVPGTAYLPPTPGQVLDGMQIGQQGRVSYEIYKARAVFPDFVTEAVKAMIGSMHSNPPIIELPPALEPLMDIASVHGEGLELLLRRINEAQLVAGRIGLLLDLPTTGNPSLPYIATYDTETVINWDSGEVDAPTLQSLNMVVLNESHYKRVDYFEWRLKIAYRVLMLGDPFANEPSGEYTQAIFQDEQTFTTEKMEPPVIRGRPLEQIPFVFVNATDLLPTPQKPPLLQLANLCLAIYRGEADYRQSLFMQGQDTLVVIGGKDGETYRVGSGTSLNVPIDGDAKFIGTNSSGIPEQRSALENDRQRAKEISGQLLDSTSRSKESGEALKVRVAAQTATLRQIALAGAAGLQEILRKAAEWVGANPDQVSVQANTDFGEAGLTAAEFLAFQQAKGAGAPISDESLHKLYVENDLTDMDFAEEMAKIAQEQAAAAKIQAPQNRLNAGRGIMKRSGPPQLNPLMDNQPPPS